jgi:hypothetical protein
MAHGDPPGTFSFFPTIYLLAWRNNDPMAATANGQVRDPKFNVFNMIDQLHPQPDRLLAFSASNGGRTA